MSLVHIKEIPNSDNSVTLQVDGRLDSCSIPVLEKICQRHLDEECKVYLNIAGLYHISREGRRFLMGIADRVIVEELPSFMRLKE